MFGPDPPGQFQGLVETEVGVVLLIAYSVERQVFQPLQLLHLRFRESAHVGDVGDVSEAETEDGELVVEAPDGYDLHTAGRCLHRRRVCVVYHVLEGAARRNEPAVGSPVVVADVVHPDQFHLRRIGIDEERLLADDVEFPFGRARVFGKLEHVRIFTDEVLQDIALAIDLRRPPVDVVEGPHIVKAARVVLVVVRKEDGIQVAEPVREHLHPEIRACVDQHLEPFVLDID